MSRMIRLGMATLVLALAGAAAAAPAAAPRPSAPARAAVPSFRTFQSEDYTIHTDLEPGIAIDLARRMDLMHEEYSRRLDNFKLPAAAPRCDVYLFAHRADYLRFVGKGFSSTGGAFVPGQNKLAAFLEGQGRDALRRTLQHEAFHQFASQAFGASLPIWLNEGMAQYFEEGIWIENRFLPGQVSPARLRQLSADIRAGRLIPFQQFLAITPEQWAATLSSRGQTRGVTQYNQAWAMVHFLVNAADASGQPLYRNRLIAMLQRLREGDDTSSAFERSFGRNYEGFQRFFIDFARKAAATPEATYMERQEVIADMLMAAREHRWPSNSIAELRDTVASRRVHIDYSRGQIHWSTDADTSLYFRALGGELLDASALYLSPRRAGALPDIICRYSPTMQLRTRFYTQDKSLQHDTTIEPISPPVLASPRR